MPRGTCTLVALAFLSISAPSLSARAEEAMSYLSPNDVISSETIVNGGQLDTFLNVAPPLPPGPNLVCRRIVIPIEVFIRPCSFFNYCPDGTGNGVVYIVRVRCRHINPPPPPPLLPRADTTGTILRTLRDGTFQVTDVSTLPNSTNTVVSFGFPAGARYGLPSDFSGNCPRGTVLITSPALQSLGNKSVCVQTAATANDSLVQTQAAQRFASLAANPGNADTDLPSLRDLLQSVLGTLVAAVVCRTDEEGHIALCLRHTGNVDFPETVAISNGLCPVVPRVDLFNACVGRGNQTPIGCGVIACVEALNDRGLAGCISAISVRPGLPPSPARAVAATAACKLMARGNHFYTAPRNGSGLEICQTTNAACTQTSVVNTLLADVRRNAPYVLQGPPSGGVAASLQTTPMPIDQSNPSRLYYLGGYVQLGPDVLIPTNTSNPITVSVGGGGPSCFAVTNTANVDHLLVGTATQCIYQEGTAIKSLVTGTGNGRFALLNTLAGPIALGTAQQALRDAVQAQLPPPSGPRPPRPPCPRTPCPAQP
jgi:hypothetical protein